METVTKMCHKSVEDFEMWMVSIVVDESLNWIYVLRCNLLRAGNPNVFALYIFPQLPPGNKKWFHETWDSNKFEGEAVHIYTLASLLPLV
jgi:hypothetical protein